MDQHHHYDDERADGELRRLLDEIRTGLAAAREDLSAALERIRQLEEQTPEARQAEYEADVALADAAESGHDESWRSTLADYHVASGGADYDLEQPRLRRVRDGACCERAVHDNSVGWWCLEHGDQPYPYAQGQDPDPGPEEYDPGPEIDDEGGMSEYRYVLSEDYERGQS